METYETEQYKGYTIKIEYDTDPMSPREWDNLGTMTCSHRRYNLGDEQFDAGNFEGWDDVRASLVAAGARVILPLRLLDHSGISMSVGSDAHPHDPGGWDSGQVGFIYVTAAKLREEYSVKRITKAIEAKAEEVLRAEVTTYDEYLTGDVYGYVIEDPDGNDVESCWGFYGGTEYVMSEAKSIVDGLTPAEEVLARTATLEEMVAGALSTIQADAGITDTTKAAAVAVKALREAHLLTNTTEGTNN